MPDKSPSQLFRRISLMVFVGALCCVSGKDRGHSEALVSSVGVVRGESSPAEFRRGFIRKVYVDPRGDRHHYVIFLPQNYRQGDKPPVIMFLNGFGENGGDGVRQISNNFGVQVWENQEFFPFLVVAPQCGVSGAWGNGSPDTIRAMEILDQTIKEFGADEDRVSLTGVSAGGSGVWALAGAYPGRFAAVVPLCGVGAGVFRSSGSRIPIWSFHNSRDVSDLVEGMRKDRLLLIQNGLSPIFTEYNAHGHDCWNRAYRTIALYEWLARQRRTANEATSPFNYLLTERLIQDWVSLDGGKWTAEPNEVLGGCCSSAGKRGRLESNSAAAIFDLHADVWGGPGSDCRIALRRESAPEGETPYWVSIVPRDLGSGGVISPDGEWLARLDPAAQNTLAIDSWNDVRIRVESDRLTVVLNGWPATDVVLKPKSANSQPTAYRYALATSNDSTTVRWRYVRTRHEQNSQASVDEVSR